MRTQQGFFTQQNYTRTLFKKPNNPPLVTMDKKTAMAVTAILVFLCATNIGSQFIQPTAADPMVWVGIPQIGITVPKEAATYASSNLTVTFHGDGLVGYVEYADVKYYLDGKLVGRVEGVKPQEYYSVILTNIPDGQHIVKVSATVTAKESLSYRIVIDWTGPFEIEGNATFKIDTSGPSLAFVNRQNSTFKTANVALNFTAEEPVSPAYYCLDGKITEQWSPIMAHIYGKDNYQLTLNQLENGLHSLRVYAADVFGNVGESETYFFTVNVEATLNPTVNPPTSTPIPTLNTPASSTPTQEPALTEMPTKGNALEEATLIIVGSAMAAAVVATALAYYKSCKKAIG